MGVKHAQIAAWNGSEFVMLKSKRREYQSHAYVKHNFFNPIISSSYVICVQELQRTIKCQAQWMDLRQNEFLIKIETRDWFIS